jgi:hypothetical protein
MAWARSAPAPVALRQAAASAAVSASCATARQRERLLRKSRATANGRIESQSPRNQSPEGQRGAAQRSAPAAPSQRPAAGCGSSPGFEAPRSRTPAAKGPRPQSPATTGAAPEEVSWYREAAAGAKSSGSRYALSRRSLQSSTSRTAALRRLKRRRPGGMVSARDSRHRIAQHGAPRTPMAVAI